MGSAGEATDSGRTCNAPDGERHLSGYKGGESAPRANGHEVGAGAVAVASRAPDSIPGTEATSSGASSDALAAKSRTEKARAVAAAAAEAAAAAVAAAATAAAAAEAVKASSSAPAARVTHVLRAVGICVHTRVQVLARTICQAAVVEAFGGDEARWKKEFALVSKRKGRVTAITNEAACSVPLAIVELLLSGKHGGKQVQCALPLTALEPVPVSAATPRAPVEAVGAAAKPSPPPPPRSIGRGRMLKAWHAVCNSRDESGKRRRAEMFDVLPDREVYYDYFELI